MDGPASEWTPKLPDNPTSKLTTMLCPQGMKQVPLLEYLRDSQQRPCGWHTVTAYKCLSTGDNM